MAKVPSDFSQWKWPWKEGEVDEEKAAKLIWNARRNEEAAEDKAKELSDKVTEVQAELDTEKGRKSGTDEEGQQKIKDLTKQVRDLEAAKTALETAKTELETNGRPQDKAENDRLSVALQLGLSERDAKRLVGETKDELLKDAKAFAEEHGIEIEGDEEDGGEGEEGGESGGESGSKPPIGQPQPRFKTGARSTDPVTVPSNTDAAAKALPSLWS